MSNETISYSTFWFLMLLEKKESFRQHNEGGYFNGGSTSNFPASIDRQQLVEVTKGKAEYVVSLPAAT
jgi:hypothetical protein